MLQIATAFVPQCVDPAARRRRSGWRPAWRCALEALGIGAYAAAGRALPRRLSSEANWRRFGRACALAMGAAAVALHCRTGTR